LGTCKDEVVNDFCAKAYMGQRLRKDGEALEFLFLLLLMLMSGLVCMYLD
jgi:hypothetical protein